jgi:hypothetical protein
MTAAVTRIHLHKKRGTDFEFPLRQQHQTLLQIWSLEAHQAAFLAVAASHAVYKYLSSVPQQIEHKPACTEHDQEQAQMDGCGNGSSEPDTQCHIRRNTQRTFRECRQDGCRYYR